MPPNEGSCLLSYGEELCSSAAGGQKGETWHWLEAWELVLFRISSTSAGIGPPCPTGVRTHTRPALSLQAAFSRMAFLQAMPSPATPNTVRAGSPGLPACRPAGSLATAESLLRSFPVESAIRTPSQLTKFVIHSSAKFSGVLSILSLAFISWIVTGLDIF